MGTTNATPRTGYSVREVADSWGVTTRTIWTRIAAGELRTFKVGRAVRIFAEDVHRVATPSSPASSGPAA